jgi:polysaccharide biosynthesis protein PslH
MSGIVVVSVEHPWPSTNGGRLRTAKLIEAVAAVAPASVVAFGTPTGAEPVDIVSLPVPHEGAIAAARAHASTDPALGRRFLGRHETAMRKLVSRQEVSVVVWSHSYLAAVGMRWFPGLAHVIDMANVETQRWASIAAGRSGARRLVARAERRKAERWEPCSVRDADLCIALCDDDQRWLDAHDASAVLCPNGVDSAPYVPSPVHGDALFVASFDYEPNVAAASTLIAEVWPKVVAARPDATLRIVGRAADRLTPLVAADPTISVTADVATLDPWYRDASVVLAPIEHGAGRQLKVTEALAHHRAVVATPFSSRSAPVAALADGRCRVADIATMADAIVDLRDRVDHRHAVERSSDLTSWADAFRPMTDRVAVLLDHKKVAP